MQEISIKISKDLIVSITSYFNTVDIYASDDMGVDAIVNAIDENSQNKLTINDYREVYYGRHDKMSGV